MVALVLPAALVEETVKLGVLERDLEAEREDEAGREREEADIYWEEDYEKEYRFSVRS